MMTVTGLINVGIYFIAAAVVVVLAIFIFDILAKYKVWKEINDGNLSVAMATGGIALGVANIMNWAIKTNDKLIDTIIWGVIGTVVLIVVYFAFELLTPKLNVTEEIEKGNKAVGFISLVFSISFSCIIAACIS